MNREPLEQQLADARRITRDANTLLVDLSAQHRNAILKNRAEAGDYQDPIAQARADVLAGKATIKQLQLELEKLKEP